MVARPKSGFSSASLPALFEAVGKPAGLRSSRKILEDGISGIILGCKFTGLSKNEATRRAHKFAHGLGMGKLIKKEVARIYGRDPS